jgi:hypothetical protein
MVWRQTLLAGLVTAAIATTSGAGCGDIKAQLDRKRVIVARCLPEAIGAGKAEKNARGRITLEFVISAAGKAQSIKVAEATLESEMVQDCTKQHVAGIDFGALPRSLEWSYTYSFEAY